MTAYNVYEHQDQEKFNALKYLVESHPRGFKQMLEAKGRCRCPGNIPEHAYLLQWMNAILPNEAKELQTKEKCWWILHGLTHFPECHNCGRTIRSEQFTSIMNGYRSFCCTACAFSSNEFGKHISESQAKALENDPDFYKNKGIKNKHTRMQRNGGAYFSQKSLEKRKDTISKDPDFWKRRDKKTKQTKAKNGHSPTWNNPEKNAQTRLENHNGKWEDEHTLLHRKQTSQRKYDADDPNQSDIVKQHKAQSFERKYGIGVKCWFQTPESRVHMKAVNEQRKCKELATKRKNGTFNTSRQEENAYHMLHFMHPHLIRQHKSREYPFNCDFYDPLSDTYFECNFSWTHGGHWFNPADQDDVARVEFMRSKQSKYYDNAIETWTVRDVKKRRCAEDNNLRYVVFWNEKEVRRYVLDELQKIANRV